jgi:XTP/dITP diphosphohydrolase
MEALVFDKTVKAFARVRRPIFVDHTGLHFDLLDGFPGGLTEIFFNRLKNAGLAEMIGRSSLPTATAVTMLGYCDGKKIDIFKGRIEGRIAPEPRGPGDFGRTQE